MANMEKQVGEDEAALGLATDTSGGKGRRCYRQALVEAGKLGP